MEFLTLISDSIFIKTFLESDRSADTFTAETMVEFSQELFYLLLKGCTQIPSSDYLTKCEVFTRCITNLRVPKIALLCS